LDEYIPVDNVPTGAYPYAPIYRRIGTLSIGRQVFHSPKRIYSQVNLRFYALKAEGREIRRVLFHSKGDPALDANLGRTASILKSAGFNLTVLTSGGMLWREDVREDLGAFDTVILTLDAATEETWRRVLRPHPLLKFHRVIDGLLKFSSAFTGRLVALIHVVETVNYDDELPPLRELLRSMRIDQVLLKDTTREGRAKELLEALEASELKVRVM